MLNLRYSPFSKPSGPATIMAPTRVRALDVGIVIDLDARGGASRPKTSATPSSNSRWALFSAMRRPSCSRALVSAISTISRFSPRCGHGDFHLVLGAQRQRFGQQLAVRECLPTAGSARARCARRRTGRRRLPALRRSPCSRGMAREIGPVAPVLPGAEEEHLDAGLAAFADTRRTDRLRRRWTGLMPWLDWIWLIARRRSRSRAARFEIQRLGRRVHLRRPAASCTARLLPARKASASSHQFAHSRSRRRGRRRARCSA